MTTEEISTTKCIYCKPTLICMNCRENKRCPICSETKPINEFKPYTSYNGKPTRKSYCQPCEVIKAKAYREKYRDACREKDRLRYLRNTGKISN